jgi:hypothetical protein
MTCDRFGSDETKLPTRRKNFRRVKRALPSLKKCANRRHCRHRTKCSAMLEHVSQHAVIIIQILINIAFAIPAALDWVDSAILLVIDYRLYVRSYPYLSLYQSCSGIS